MIRFIDEMTSVVFPGVLQLLQGKTQHIMTPFLNPPSPIP